MSVVYIPRTPFRGEVSPVAQAALVDIIISDELFGEINVEVEPTSYCHINVNITRRKLLSEAPIQHSEVVSGPEDELNSPDIAAWLEDIASEYSEAYLLGFEDKLNYANIATLLADVAACNDRFEDEREYPDIPAWLADVAACYVPYLRSMDDNESNSASPHAQNTPLLLEYHKVPEEIQEAGPLRSLDSQDLIAVIRSTPR